MDSIDIDNLGIITIWECAISDLWLWFGCCLTNHIETPFLRLLLLFPIISGCAIRIHHAHEIQCFYISIVSIACNMCSCVVPSISDIVHNVPKLNIYEQTLGQQVEMLLYLYMCKSRLSVCFVVWLEEGVHFGCARSSIRQIFGMHCFLLHTKTGTSTTKNAEWTKEKSQQHIMELSLRVADCAWTLVCEYVFVYYIVRYNSIDSLIWIDSLQLIHVSFDTITSKMASTLNTLTRNCFASSISKLFASTEKKWGKRTKCPYRKCKSQELAYSSWPCQIRHFLS